MSDVYRDVAMYTQALLPEQAADPHYLFPLGELPEPLTAAAQQLSKQTDALHSMVEGILSDLNEQTAKQDIVRLHRAILTAGKFLGALENSAKLWRLAALSEISHAPVSKWLSRRYEKISLTSGSTARGSASANSSATCYGAMYRILW